jgi:hypothetical protein
MGRMRVSIRSRALLAVSAAAIAGLLLLPGGASAATCPSFRVLHNDRIGAASFPAGSYSMTTGTAASVSCAAASKLFTSFLEDYDGRLPGG